jgi:heat shock protein HslJ
MLKLWLSIILLVMATSGCVAPRCDHCSIFYDIHWKLVELKGAAAKTFEGERETWLQFSKDDNRMHGSGGCNRFFGSYELEGNSLRFGEIGATRMFCADAMEQEDAFFAMLGEATRYRMSGNQLELFNRDKLTARFGAVPVQ